MANRYRSRRRMRKLARQSRRNFIISVILIVILLYATINWILPFLISSLDFARNIVKPSQKITGALSEDTSLAPPILNIPYEATNSAQIDIKGYGNPGSKVKLYLDDEAKKTVDVSSDGSFNFENISLNVGINNIYGKTVDENNHESLPSKLLKITFDNEKPFLNLAEPEDGKKIQGGDKKIRVAGQSEPGVKVFVNGNQLIVDKEGRFSTDQPLNDGDNIISVEAIDLASNITEIERKVTFTP